MSSVYYTVEIWQPIPGSGGDFKYSETIHKCLLLQEAQTVYSREAWKWVDDATKWHRIIKHGG